MFYKSVIKINQCQHPNAQPGEYYLGDFCEELIAINSWKTKRVGVESEEKTASGKKQFQVFVSKDEMEKAYLDPKKTPKSNPKFPQFIITITPNLPHEHSPTEQSSPEPQTALA